MTERVLATYAIPAGAMHDLSYEVLVPNGTLALRLSLSADGAVSDVEMRVARCGVFRDGGSHAGNVALSTPWCGGPFGGKETVTFSATGAMSGQLVVHARRVA